MSDSGDTVARAPKPPPIEDEEQLRAWLHAEHGVAVGKDDPVMLVHSIHRAALADYERMLERHNEAITETLGSALDASPAPAPESGTLEAEGLSENVQALSERIEAVFARQLKRALVLSAANLVMFTVCLVVGIAQFVA